MRPATKQTLFLVILIVSLAILVAIALWQMEKAKREGPSPHSAGRPALAYRAALA